MSNVQFVATGKAGADYVKERLHGAGPLPERVLPLFEGSTQSFALVAKDLPQQKVLAFNNIAGLQSGECHADMADYVAQRWKNSGQVVFTDPWMKPSDFVKFPPRIPYFWSEGNIYYMPDGPDLAARLDAGNQATRQFQVLGFIVDPSVTLPSTGSQVESDYMERLAQHVLAAFASAYDRESYVLWEGAND